jgi:glycine betaine/proline transport system ATP-binding protein
MIRAEGIYKVFGDRPRQAIKLLQQGKSKAEVQAETGQVVANQDISFEQKKGELFVIMGLSGSGKSTFLRCVNRLVEPTLGKIFLAIDPKDPVEITTIGRAKLRVIREKYISMIFQGFALFPHRTVLSNVTFSLEIQGKAKSELLRRGNEMLEIVGLSQWGDAYPAQLSGGMQQRVGLARALVTGAPVVLMDEAFSALDPLIRVNMQDELLKLHEQFKRTNLFVTHDLDEALKLGDRIAIMEEGRFVQIGTPEQILINPNTEYVERFVENADPSNVVSAGTIATPLENLSRLDQGRYQLDNQDMVMVDQEGHPTEAVVNTFCRPVLLHDEVGDQSPPCFLAVRSSESIRTVMKLRMDSLSALSAPNPVFIVDEHGILRGVINEFNILQGLLLKGKQRTHYEQQ